MNPICKSDLLAPKAVLLLSLLMHALEKCFREHILDTRGEGITTSEVREEDGIKVKMMRPPCDVAPSVSRTIRALNQQVRRWDHPGQSTMQKHTHF